MRSFFKKYLPFTRGDIESAMEYRMSFVIWFLMDVLYVVIAYFTWRAVFNSSESDTIEGFTFVTMVAYLFIQRIVFSLTFIQPHWYITDDIKSGSIAMQLIKPINYQIKLFFQGLGTIVINLMFFVGPMLVLFVIANYALDLGFTVNLYTLVIFMISIILALFINFLVSYSFGLLVFFTIGGFGIWQLKQGVEMLFSGALIPLVFFPLWFQRVADFLPFSKVIYVPTQILLGNIPSNEVFGVLTNQLMWVGIMFVTSAFFWRKTFKKVVIMGG
jgi:ABC-2 type transport system permease protein